ncbi:hypothetical protein BH10ACT11_BH10ACT11_06990 [soil metagenome]
MSDEQTAEPEKTNEHAKAAGDPSVFGENFVDDGAAPLREPPKRILVAGIGNAWLGDDGFGSEVAERLMAQEVSSEVKILDFGSGGLDLAYEVMRGYDALLMVDVSRQGGEPGTLYVMEPDADEIEPIGDGEVVSPHGMDPLTVLRFVKTVGGWPGKIRIVACEPGNVEDLGMGLTPEVTTAIEGAVNLVNEQIAELLTDEAYAQEAAADA